MISKKSTLALVLGMIIMASSLASASYLNDFGGARSTSASSGSTAGAVSKIQLVNDGSGTIDSIGYGNVLREWIRASASVPNGVTGEASASVDTEGAKAFRSRLSGQPDENNYAYISTSLDGKVEASVTKTSQQGSAQAIANMQSETGASITNWGKGSGVADKALGGSALLSANIYHTGIGSALANAEGDALFDGALSARNDPLGLGMFDFGTAYTTGWAKGNVKLTGSNVKYGGLISGLAAIRSGTSLANRVGRSVTTEELCLRAERDISFEGDSTIEGIVDGLESGETKIGDTTVDVETSSVMNGKARALNRHDSANVFLLVNSRTGTDGKNAISDNVAYGSAKTTRDSTGSAGEKAEAEGYITDATWTASTSLKADVENKYRYASVQGKLGGTPDGLPEDLPGLGVGSWIMNPYINPMQSQAWSYELAATGKVADGAVPQTLSTLSGNPNPKGSLQNTLSTRVNTAEYRMILNGMKVTDETNDAVGAYLGVDTQIMTNIVDGYIPTRQETRTLTIAPMNGIQWIEGNNPSLLPGTYTPPIVPFGLSQTAVARNSGLRNVQKQV
jgi:hypothetical protein